MIEVFRHADPALVGLYQSILEDAGCATYVRNYDTQQTPVASLATAIAPLFIFYPTLCVVRDEDYAAAREIIGELRRAPAPQGADWRCPQCGEAVPANFDSCWQCQSPPGGDT